MSKMAKRGYVQGDMSPTVEDYQKPNSEYSQSFMNKTTDYIGRHNSYESKEASGIKKQAYKGRYS